MQIQRQTHTHTEVDRHQQTYRQTQHTQTHTDILGPEPRTLAVPRRLKHRCRAGTSTGWQVGAAEKEVALRQAGYLKQRAVA